MSQVPRTVEGVTGASPTVVTQAFVYALDPSPEQESALLSHIGASRFAYNHLLHRVLANWDENRTRKEVGEEVTREDYLSTNHFGLLYQWAEIRDHVAPWWKENGVSAYNDAAQRLSRALSNFYAGRARAPHYRRRGVGESVRFLGQSVRLVDTHHVRISRVGEVKTYESTRKLARHLERGTGRIVAATVSRHGARWSVSFTAEIERPLPETRAPERVIGVDRGLGALYVGATSSGEGVLRVANPHYLIRSQAKLAKLQRQVSRKQGPRPGVAPSNRWRRANARVQKLHAQVAHQRRDLIHNVTTRLAKNYDRIVIEDLNVKVMVRNSSLAKAISDAAWSEFSRQLAYKTQWYGSELVLADRLYPSSKTCSRCGAVKAKLPLDVRVYECEACGLSIDRDTNAAINLAGWPRKTSPAGTDSVAGRRGEVRPRSRAVGASEAHPEEASTEAPTLVGV